MITEQVDQNEPRFFSKRVYIALAIFLALAFVILYLLFSPAPGFPERSIFKVEQGQNLDEISSNLQSEGYIRSRLIFKLAVIIAGNSKNLKSGNYFFAKPYSVFEIARRLAEGISGLETVRITIPEGFNLRQIASLFEKMRMFTAGEFYRKTGEPAADFRRANSVAKPEDFSDVSGLLKEKPALASLEGYLFPDTYFLEADDSLEDVLEKIIQNLEKKITPEIRAEARNQRKTIHKILTMASLLEEEAKNEEDWKIIAGILWKRLDIGMALQVDATLRYAAGKNSGELSEADFKIDSLFNTYKYPGLPPGPISNPGIAAIEAALNYTTSPYFYYLSGQDGAIHYAKTFEEHKINREKYLK